MSNPFDVTDGAEPCRDDYHADLLYSQFLSWYPTVCGRCDVDPAELLRTWGARKVGLPFETLEAVEKALGIEPPYTHEPWIYYRVSFRGQLTRLALATQRDLLVEAWQNESEERYRDLAAGARHARHAAVHVDLAADHLASLSRGRPVASTTEADWEVTLQGYRRDAMRLRAYAEAVRLQHPRRHRFKGRHANAVLKDFRRGLALLIWVRDIGVTSQRAIEGFRLVHQEVMGWTPGDPKSVLQKLSRALDDREGRRGPRRQPRNSDAEPTECAESSF